MKLKCKDCSHIQEITLDRIIFDDEAEEAFVSYLAAELSKSQSEKDEDKKSV